MSDLAFDLPDFDNEGLLPAGDGSGVPEIDPYTVIELEDLAPEKLAGIAAAAEMRCAVCGCSDSQACRGGCIWASDGLCSRCALEPAEGLDD